MIRLFLAAFLFFLWSAPRLAAQGSRNFNSRVNHLAVGVKGELNMGSSLSDILTGAAVNTPYLFDRVALRGALHQGFFRGVPTTATSSNELWMGYTAVSGGVSIALTEALRIGRLYTDFGWIGIIPHPQFSDTPFAWGVYATLGLDFLFSPEDFWGIFIEAGARGMMTGGTAENIRGNPVYGSGIILAFGLRLFL